MGVATFPDIFQAKMSELMATLEFVHAYIDDLLCITTGSLEDHLAKLELVLTRLQDAGLKVNAGESWIHTNKRRTAKKGRGKGKLPKSGTGMRYIKKLLTMSRPLLLKTLS
jgi:hypothetical protein